MRAIDALPCRVHVFVCANTRPPGGLPSCDQGGQGLFDALKLWALHNRHARTVWVTQTRCLGYCHAAGATLAFYYPGSSRKPVFLQAVTQSDLPEVVQRYIVAALAPPVA